MGPPSAGLGRVASLLLVAASTLGGCMLGPDYRAPEIPLAADWQAPLPHGASRAGLADWWRQFNDPALSELLRLAETDSPSLDQAWARILQARATLTGNNADALPSLNATLTQKRGQVEEGELRETGSMSASGLDASWEIDLFGKLRRYREAASTRLEARVDDWHAARVSLAAEVGDHYVQYRGCQKLVEALRDQAQSQRKTADLTRLSHQAGFTSPADAALGDASAASSAANLTRGQSECDLLLKSLVELTGSEEPRLVAMLGQGPTRLPSPAQLDVRAIPADLLRQRPDLAARERELAAANAEVGAAQADRLPSLSLGGSFSVGATAGISERSWSIGPSLSIPLFDGGKRGAAVQGAEAAYDSALAVYRQTLRRAVREVEQALVRLDAARHLEADAERASAGYDAYYQAIDRNWQAGSASLLDREVARRSALASEIELIGLQQNQVRHWIALYKALGGGWQAQPLELASKTAPGQAASDRAPSEVAE
ncbi:MAG TPA: efflux transporter outer membrane subunit [Pseudomonas sp.]|nr:efflux transporter outer membrane subunit [Pseudomonas sp.]